MKQLYLLIPSKCILKNVSFPFTPLIKYSQYLTFFTLLKIFMPDMQVRTVKHYQYKHNLKRHLCLSNTYKIVVLGRSMVSF